MSHRGRWWVAVVPLVGAAAAEWLRRPAPGWVWLAWALALGGVAALRPLAGWRRRGLAAVLAGLALAVTVAQGRLTRVETQWPAEREARVEAASNRLAGDLHAAYHRAARLAEAAAGLDPADRGGAFDVLRRLVPSGGPEMGVALLEPSGLPWAWAGRHRLPPVAAGDSIAARATGYYVVLEARRHSPAGRAAVASVLVWSHPAVPDPERALAELFRERTGVGLAVYPPGSAPDGGDVFDYSEPTTAGPRLLFSVRPVPPEQGAAKERLLAQAGRVLTWAALLAFALALTLTAAAPERFVILLGALWLAVRAPVGPALGLEPLFSPATFFHPLFGPLSSSAGTLALAGALVTAAGVWLWGRRLGRRWYAVAIAVALTVAAPYLVREVGRGITPPATGVGPGLWLTWQLALLLVATAVLVPTAALLRGVAAEAGGVPRIALGVAVALAAAAAGLVLWTPGDGWPGWYSLLWLPALVLVTLPAPRVAAVGGVALVAGMSVALVTWGAELAGKLQVAQRDLARLEAEADPLALPLLERLGEEARRGPPPTGATEMYALWRGSALSEQGYPGHLALWTDGGGLEAELPLDSLDLPRPLLATLVRDHGARPPQRVVPLLRSPGTHYLLLARVAPDRVLSVGVGPRSQLVAPGRIGRLLDPPGRRPLYRLALTPPRPEGPAAAPAGWRREGWLLRSESPLRIPGAVRTVQAVVDLRGPFPVLVRGVLVVLLDVAVLAVLWGGAELAAGARPRPPRWRSLARSFRARLAAALFAFFIVPAAGFATWSFARLAEEATRGRDLVIAQTLRDAVITAGGSLGADPSLAERLRELSGRVEAELALYRGGRLEASSAELLEDLGIVARLMDPAAFTAIALAGEVEVTRAGPVPRLAERVGYRLVQPGPAGEVVVLATPQLADDPTLAVRRLDLALVLLLATLAGVAAALTGAQVAARALSRPVADLRRSALAIGRGEPTPPHAGRPPLEFEPVFGAFERMAADVRASQGALEEARRRTAAVLATVATGVVGLDPDGRVLIANRQAVDLLGVALGEGDPFLERLGGEWEPLAAAVRAFLTDPSAPASAELDVGGRRLTLQLASLGPDVRGVVVALHDVTDLSRAERVLAWGEMARQVAHEIKNPLTPMRLGMQHLRRVWRDRRDGFDHALEETAARVLAEIDRLDTIARAFSRFAAPEEDHAPPDRINLAAVVGEVVQLYRLADAGCEVRLEAAPGAVGAARPDEVKEVVVNLLENARNAGARAVTVVVAPRLLQVRDDGMGIPAELLPRIFEPRFSTTTSGSGLGLAIVRRLVEGWRGLIEVESEVGRGTTVTVRLPG